MTNLILMSFIPLSVLQESFSNSFSEVHHTLNYLHFFQTQSELVLEIWKNIQASYKQSIQEVSQIISLKIKFLKSLKC